MHRIVEKQSLRIATEIVFIVYYLKVRTKANHCLTDFSLKTFYDGGAQDHQSHADGDTIHGNTHNGPGDVTCGLVSYDSTGYVGSDVQG